MKNRACIKIGGFVGMACLSAMLVTGCSQKAEVVSEDIPQESQTYETLAASNADRFSYNDLTVNNLKFGMTEEEVKNILGEPANMHNSNEIKELPAGTDVLDEKVYSYNDLTLIFMPVSGTYKLCAAASVGDTDIFSRGIKVGDSRDKILELYYRDEACLNNNVMTEDNATIIGKFLYGNYTIDKIDSQKEKNKVEYGVINYIGYSSLETAASYIIEFTYFEPPYQNDAASLNDDFAQMAFDIDGNGIITGIRWYYYPKIQG